MFKLYSVKVYILNENYPVEFTNIRSCEVVDGHLFLYTQIKKDEFMRTQAIFAPGMWKSVVILDLE